MKLDDMKKGLVAIDDGIWVSDLPQVFFAGIRLKVRRLWNVDYSRLYGEMTASLPRDQATGELTIEADAERMITDECLKRATLVDWDGIDDEFSPANVDRVFADPELRTVWRNAIILAASRAATTFTASIEADAKN